MKKSRCSKLTVTVVAVSFLAFMTGCADRVMPIGYVQGAVEEGGAAEEHRSPVVGKIVSVRGVVCQKTLMSGEGDHPQYGFLIQNTPDTADKSPLTSDGLYIHLHTNRVIQSGTDSYEPQIGDELVLRGKIEERRRQTVMAQPVLLGVLRSAVNIEEELGFIEARPPVHADEAARYWERREGMLFSLPADCIMQGGRKSSRWNTFSIAYGIRADLPVSQRTNVYARRVFRDSHPLDDLPSMVDNGNGYRICIGDYGLKDRAKDLRRLLPPVQSLATLAEPVRGGLLQWPYSYTVHPFELPRFTESADPSSQPPVTQPAESNTLRIGTYNVENLYDFNDDPFDRRDFAVSRDDTNGPVKLENYVPDSQEAYTQRLKGIAEQIVVDLGAPDVLLLQEVEDQDILMAGQYPVASFVDNRDGVSDILQDLCDVIQREGGIHYLPAMDRAGADMRGINCGFLYRPERIQLKEPTAGHPLLGATPDVPALGRCVAFTRQAVNPKALNLWDHRGLAFSRCPQIALFSVLVDQRETDLYIINNHFKSRPDKYIEKRRSQAAFNASLVERIRRLNPAALIVVGGDLNVFPRPDEPIPEEPTDQLGALYEAGLSNLYDVILRRYPSAAYTYIFEGQSQTLDHLFVNGELHQRLVDVYPGHLNSDYTYESHHPARGVSDHDPVLADFSLE